MRERGDGERRGGCRREEEEEVVLEYTAAVETRDLWIDELEMIRMLVDRGRADAIQVVGRCGWGQEGVEGVGGEERSGDGCMGDASGH